MARHNNIGKAGEQAVKAYLIKKGYQFITQNWKSSHAEIDLIFKDRDILVFVEVKTRTNIHYGLPTEFLNEKQEKLIINASQRYMESINYDWEIRFDVVAVLVNDKLEVKSLEHFEDVFY